METQISEDRLSTQAVSDNETLQWQKKLLPLMKRMIIFLTLFFFVASFGQLIYLQVSINDAPKINISHPLNLLQNTGNVAFTDRQSVALLEAKILLESNTMERRHHQANVLLMSSIWVRYLGFVTGMILALIGAIFILGKLEEKNVSEITGKMMQGEATLKSSSPGIVLVVLGSALMIVTIAMQHTIQVNDVPVYLQGGPDAGAFINTGSQRKPELTIPPIPDTLRLKGIP